MAAFHACPARLVNDLLRVLPQYLLPKQALTSLMGALARREGGGLTTWLIRHFVTRYGVDMNEAHQPDIAAYAGAMKEPSPVRDVSAESPF